MRRWVRLAAVSLASTAVLAIGVARSAEVAPASVTLTGKIACASCILKLKDVKTCTNVLVVQEQGKDVLYALAENAVTKAYDMAACEKAIPVKVTGTVTERAGNRTITPAKIEKT